MGDDYKPGTFGPNDKDDDDSKEEKREPGQDQAGTTNWRPVYSSPSTENEIRKIAAEEAEKRKPKGGFFKGLLCVLLGGALGVSVVFGLAKGGKLPQVADKSGSQGQQSVNIQLEDGESTVEKAVAAKAIPSIVGITSISEGSYINPFLYGIPKYTEAVGSGVIVSSDGMILTNAHVVEGGTKQITVLLSDGTEAEAAILWSDPTLDLAVIKIDKKGLTPIKFAKKEAQVGDKAIAIGNPLGLDLQSTLTSGYISGLDRSITVEGGNIMNGLIQTDAAINGGNSGGALLNAKGELIGVNTAKAGGADGIGFAIPVTTAEPIVDRIVKTGSYEPTYLGLRGFDAGMARSMGLDGLPVSEGVVVHEILAGSPADKAGIKPGDVITGLDDHKVASMNSLKTLLLNYQIGDKAKVTYYRGQKEHTTKVEFTEISQMGI